MACNWFASGRKRKTEQGPPSPVTTAPPLAPPPPSSGGGGAVLRVTSDADAVLNRIYSYWPNAWLSGATIDAFVGLADGKVHFFSVERSTGVVQRHGPKLPYASTGEGWWFDSQGRVYLCEGPRLRRCLPFEGDDQVVFDVSTLLPGCRIWQAHASDDGTVYSATVEKLTSDGPYQRVGTVVSTRGILSFYPAIGALDESQVDASGRWLLIKEGDDNRIVDLTTGRWRVVTNAEGALGHSDNGPGYAVGEDDQAGVCVKVDLESGTRLVLFNTWGMGHVSVRGSRCLLSDVTRLALVDLNGGGVEPLLDHGMTGSGYDYQVHANLSPDGRVAAWVSNVGGRMDLYVKEL